MQPRYVAFIIFVWVTGALMGAMMDKTFVGPTEQTAIDKILVWEQVSSDESGWGIYTFAKSVPEFLSGIFDILTFKFSFLEGVWWFRWIILGPIIGLLAWALVITFISIMSKGL